jgi:hypothetical protein
MIYVGVFSFQLLTIEATQDCHLNIKSNFAATENFKNLGHILPKQGPNRSYIRANMKIIHNKKTNQRN